MKKVPFSSCVQEAHVRRMKKNDKRHAILIFKLFRNVNCEDEFLHLNFQLCDNERSQKLILKKIMMN